VKPVAGGAPGGFADPARPLDHYARHGADFGATTAPRYEQMADAFLNGPCGTGVLQKVRANGDVVRYDPATQAFGVVKTDGTIRTYYKPDPAVHGYPTNLDYFNAQ
jgi:filamentous hemagglutinin